jgi:hypothetical protein
MTTGADFNPLWDTGKNFKRAMSGRDEVMRSLQQKGMIGGLVYEGDNETVSRLLKELATGKHGLWQRAMEKLDALSINADAATRISLYEAFKKQGLSEIEAQLATMDSMNFNTHGASPSVRALSMMVPFMSAQINGLDALYKGMSGTMPQSQRIAVQKKFRQRAAMLAAVSMAYALAVQDEEWYKKATPAEKYGFFFVPVPGFDEPMKIPIPFEVGLLFKAIPEGMINTLVGDEGSAGEAAKAIGQQILNSIPGLAVPQAVKPALEGMANYSFFTGRAVESQAQQRLPIADRYGDYTTETAKALGFGFELAGKEWGLSPVMIEHLVRGYTSSLGVAVMKMTDAALGLTPGGEKPTARASENPLFGSLFQRVDGNAIVDRAFREIERAERQAARMKQAMDEGNEEKAKAIMEDPAFVSSALQKTGQQAKKQFAEIAKAMDVIRTHKDMTGEQKREQLKALTQMKNSVAEQMVQAAREARQ